MLNEYYEIKFLHKDCYNIKTALVIFSKNIPQSAKAMI